MEHWEMQSTRDRQENEFFIDTNGKIHKWKGSLKKLYDTCSTHKLIAEKLTGMDGYDAVEYLHNLGWIIIGSVCYGIRAKNEPTQSQINALFDLGYHHICIDSGERFYF